MSSRDNLICAATRNANASAARDATVCSQKNFGLHGFESPVRRKLFGDLASDNTLIKIQLSKKGRSLVSGLERRRGRNQSPNLAPSDGRGLGDHMGNKRARCGTVARPSQQRFRSAILPPRLKQALFAGASGITMVVTLAMPRAAVADNECGLANAGDTVTCTTAGNNFPDGVSYKVTDLTIVVQDGVIIDTTPGLGGGRAISSGGGGNYGDLTINVGPGTGPQVTITTDDNFGTGIYAKTLDGTVKINSDADITTLDSSSHGISGRGFTAVYVTSDGDISTSGFASQGIEAVASGGVVVVSTGDIDTAGTTAFGIIANSDGAATSVTSKGDITVTGSGSGGIYASSDGFTVTVTTIGDISTVGNDGTAVNVYSSADAVTVTSIGDLSTKGDNADGIFSKSKTDTVLITSTGDISTQGYESDAIWAQGYTGAKIYSTGNLSTVGKSANGIGALVQAGKVVVTSEGDISTQGMGAAGIGVFGIAGVTITSDGDISTKGINSSGIVGSALSGNVLIASFGDIVTEGIGAAGIGGSVLSGQVGISSTGDITTSGDQAVGINVSASVFAGVASFGNITTAGEEAHGIAGVSKDAVITVASYGNVSTTGKEADGIHLYSINGAVTVISRGDISTKDVVADGISAESKNSTVKIESEGDIATIGIDASGILATSASSVVVVTSDGDISTKGVSAEGISAVAFLGAGIASKGNIATVGDGAFGLYAVSSTSAIVITSTGAVSTEGVGADAIYAVAVDDAVVKSTGAISALGNGSGGIDVTSTGGSVNIESRGAISTDGKDATGISATSSTSDTVVISSGAIATTGLNAEGIYASARGNASITSTGNISTTGDKASGLYGYSTLAAVVINSTGNISTAGEQAIGIYASGLNAVSVTSAGHISALGQDAHGIVSTSGNAGSVVFSTGNITTQADDTFGILANGATIAQVVSQGSISVGGNTSSGIFATGVTGDVTVQSGSIQALGKGSHGIFAGAPGGAVVIDVFGTIQGGGGAGEGIFISALDASSVDVHEGGAIGSLSDVAIEGGGEDLTIINKGTITGILSLGAGDDDLANFSPTTWNLRNFADTDGDGVRDTEGVAISDFGAGNDTAINIGTLRLATVSGATTVDTTGQISHPAGGNADITQAGVEQGHLTNLELFINSGAITLRDGVAGDLLAITDAASVGAGGNGVFRSNGGSLVLDVVLDDGTSQQSDMLVLDNAATGAGGATRIFVAGLGSGAQTVGDGIQVVNVDGSSSSDAFAQGGLAVAGAYKYDLYFQNLAATDQNWYLRSSFFSGALEYPAIVTGALSTWYSDVGALHERLGERRREVEDGQTAELANTAADIADTTSVRVNDSGQGGWLRVVGADMDIEQDGPADFDLNTTRAEAGFDVGLNDVLDGDWLVLGGFAGYGWSSVGFDSGADIDFDIATVGAYATYFRGPYYLDALVKLDWLDGTYNSDAVSGDGEVELPVFGLSLETGYRFDFTAGGLYAQPQAQLSYAHSGDDSFKDDSGSKIELEDADSLRGRLGVRLGQELTSDSGAAEGNFYLEASVNQEFLGETSARVSGLTLEQELPDTTFEIGGGIDIALPEEGVSFTVDGDYTFGAEAEGVAITGGFRINW
jgi:outer membrane autotransporter protein